MLKNSRCSSHYAGGQRSWDSKVKWRTSDIAIDCGANLFLRLRYVWCDDCVSIEEVFRQTCTLPKNSKCRRATRSKVRPILTGETNCLLVHEHFGQHDAAQGPSDLFSIQVQNDDVQDFDVRWDQALLSTSETPTEMVLEGLYKSKLQESVQLETVLALYDHETVRNSGQPSYSNLKFSCKTPYLSSDQISKPPSPERDRWGRRGDQESEKGKKADVVRKVAECYLWNANGQRSRGDSCSFSHEPAFGNEREAQRRKAQQSSPAP